MEEEHSGFPYNNYAGIKLVHSCSGSRSSGVSQNLYPVINEGDGKVGQLRNTLIPALKYRPSLFWYLYVSGTSRRQHNAAARNKLTI